MSQQVLTAESPAPSFRQSLNVAGLGLDDAEFARLCHDNKDLRLELTAKGDLIIMPPTGGSSGWRNLKLAGSFSRWIEADGTGIGFDSSTMFTLPNGAKRAPDMSWLRRERWDALTPVQQDGFPPLCPDFVVELRSPTDAVADLAAKMEEYMAQGARLGWLIDPLQRRVHIYRPGAAVEILEEPVTVSGGTVLPGFNLNVSELW